MAKNAKNTNALPFDTSTLTDGWKTMARFNERFMGIALDAAEKSNDIAAKTADQAISNMRDVTVVRDEPSEYGEAITSFFQKQSELTAKTAEAYANLFREAQVETTELASEAGETLSDKAAANTNQAAEKAASAAKKSA